ncbi:facilitated trehalose transporter Tret1-like isoform X2 [Rhodnius prolixus]|uniref:facilitated trehalose transporter Tret1-like isoform X2 n=1 Tax=Rhodnius prolixus TaxID=13249 RepID=UPI003D18B6F3
MMRLFMKASSRLQITPNSSTKCTWSQGLAAFSVSLGSMVVGFSSAYTSPALESMKQPGSTLHITEQQTSWIASLMPLSALLGGIIGGALVETLGRKKTILLTAIPFGISFILIAFASNVSMIMAGRSLAGFCVGIASLALPVYLGEAIQPDVRGTLGLLPTAIGNGGILICFLAGKYLDWSKLALFGACLPIPFFILMFLIPETPRWFIGKKMEHKAKKSLEWLRGENADINKEMSELQKSTELFKENKSSIKELFNKKYLCPFAISMGLMFFQQLSGINAVIFYTVTIFKDAGSTIDSNLSAIIVGLVNLGATLVATALIDRVGRKVLMYFSNCIMAATLAILGTFFYMKNSGTDMTQYGWIPLASSVIYVIGFSIGAGPIPWLMMGEILPAKIRGSAGSMVTSFNWACTFLVTKTYVDLTLLIGSHGAFWLFGVICLISLAFVIIFVPETRGRSLEEIERYYMGRQGSNENEQVLDTLPNC